jgi:hypothetical protein
VNLPTGFCIFDVLLVFVRDVDNVEIFGVQITISEKPFGKHATQETCGQQPQVDIARLQRCLQAKFETNAEIVYVMYSPRAAEKSFVAPSQKADYYFAPPGKVVEGLAEKQTKKRKAEKCCNCTTADCTSCTKCGAAGQACNSCQSPNCLNMESTAKKGQS